jgi:hypothetical protein
MKKKMLAVVLCLALLASVLPIMVSPAPALAAASTSVHVVKYYADGTTVMNETTVNYSWMEANLPVQGDGTTHYYFQGPTFNESNMWDPDELINVDSRDMGAVNGTDVKDLCDLIGGTSSGDEIKIKANDGFSKTFDYEDVYSPEPEQGKLVICWWQNGNYSGSSYPDGMRLVFMAETTNSQGKYVFGHWDMHETLNESRWYYYYDGSTFWPSSGGLSVKYVSEVIIYTDEPAPTPTVTGSPTPTVSPTPTPTATDVPTSTPTESPTATVTSSPTPTPSPTSTPWTLFLNGATTYNMTQSEFEDGVDCHGAVTWNNADGTWSGMPLWLLCGWVDDGTQHGSGAFNDSLAASGYTVKVIASDGFSRSFASGVVARNDSMIIANLLNGSPLPSNRYPLRLVGTGLSSGQMVSKIVQIQLLFPTPTPTPTISPTSTGTPTASPTPTPTATPGPGDVNGDYVINCCDITQCELCILDPVKYPKENYPGWDANEDDTGPNAGDILAVELRILELWP